MHAERRSDAESSRGWFIVLEGVDGCGSTTAARGLGEVLQREGHEVLVTCEPSQGPVGLLIRAALEKRLQGASGARAFTPETLALLFAADRLDHLAAEVQPALGAGKVVICDRYVLSSLAYQSATSEQGAGALPWLGQLNAQALTPDVTIVLRVSADTAAQRRAARGGPEELFERVELQRRLVEVYARAQALLPGQRVANVDAEQSQAEILLELRRQLVDLGVKEASAHAR